MLIHPTRKLPRMLEVFLLLVVLFPINFFLEGWCWGQQGLDTPTSAVESKNGPFKRSEFISSKASLREGETNEYTLIVRYDGREDYLDISISLSIPGPSMLVSSSPELVLLENERELTWNGEIHKGKDLAFSVNVVTLPDSASDRTLFGSAGIFWQGGVQWLESETEIHSKLSSGTSHVMIYLMVYLLGGPALILALPVIIRIREKRHRSSNQEVGRPSLVNGVFLYAISFFFVVCLGVAHLISHIAWQDFRRFTAYRQTECVLPASVSN